MAQPTVWGILGVVSVGFIRRQRGLIAASMLGIAPALTGIVSTQLKQLFTTARPPYPIAVQHLSSPAFPSGHAASVAAAAVLVWLVAGGLDARPWLRRSLRSAAVVVAVLVGASRLVLGVHSPSDVVGGWLLGVIVVCGAAALASFATPTRSSPGASQ